VHKRNNFQEKKMKIKVEPVPIRGPVSAPEFPLRNDTSTGAKVFHNFCVIVSCLHTIFPCNGVSDAIYVEIHRFFCPCFCKERLVFRNFMQSIDTTFLHDGLQRW